MATNGDFNLAIDTGQIRCWKQILTTLTMHYGDRIAAAGY